MADAGWYPDAHDPNSQHYFDGHNWTGERRPVPAAPADETVRRGDLPTEQTSAAAYGAQSPAQSPTQQWDQPAQQQWHQPTDQWQQQPTDQWQQQPWTPPAVGGGEPPARTRRRTPIVLAAGAAVVLAAGLVTWLVWPDDDPSLTFDGKEITAANDTLTSAERALSRTVSSRHGAKDDDTRCYFAKPAKPASGKKASDVEDSLRCGPVLFVDGERRAAYLSVPLTAKSSGSGVSLSVPTDLGDRDPAPVDDSVSLERPDGKTAPKENDGAGALTVPKPPAAAADLLTTAALGPSASPKTVNTSVTGKTAKLTLESVAEVDRYGVGDDARSAAKGHKLIAFRVGYGAGDVTTSTTAPQVSVITGGTPRQLPASESSNYVVVSVADGDTASIALVDSGVTQSIALPAGTPGADALAVLQRGTRTVPLSSRLTVPITLKRGSDRGKVTFKATASLASLDYWAPANPSVSASGPSKALLSVRLNYTSSVEKGKTFGFDPKLLTLQAGGQTYRARNVAPAGKISNVFEVPANFTTGTLRIAGSTKVGSITLQVKTPRTIAISIPG